MTAGEQLELARAFERFIEAIKAVPFTWDGVDAAQCHGDRIPEKHRLVILDTWSDYRRRLGVFEKIDELREQCSAIGDELEMSYLNPHVD